MFVMCQSFVVAKLLAITSKEKVKTIYAVMASRRILMLREGSVDLVGVGGGGGGGEGVRICKKQNLQSPQRA